MTNPKKLNKEKCKVPECPYPHNPDGSPVILDFEVIETCRNYLHNNHKVSCPDCRPHRVPNQIFNKDICPHSILKTQRCLNCENSNPQNLNNEKWEDRFDNTLFPMDLAQSAMENDSPQMDLMKENRGKIKQFISQLLLSERQSVLNEVLESLPKEYEDIYPDGAIEEWSPEQARKCGINEALSKIKRLLKELKEK